MQEKLAIAGSGTIAAGLASVAAAHGDVLVWARSDASADRVRAAVAKHCEKLPALSGCAGRVLVVSELEALCEATFLIEAVIEDPQHKGPLLAELASYTGPDEILATTTSSLSIAELAQASGHPDRLVGLHVFNPVPRMELVEVAYGPHDVSQAIGETIGAAVPERLLELVQSGALGRKSRRGFFVYD